MSVTCASATRMFLILPEETSPPADNEDALVGELPCDEKGAATLGQFLWHDEHGGRKQERRMRRQLEEGASHSHDADACHCPPASESLDHHDGGPLDESY